LSHEPSLQENVPVTRPALVRLAFSVLAVALLGPWSGSACAGPGRVRPMGVSHPPDPGAAIFVRHGCTECHAISAFHVKPTTYVGPDLTLAYGDVRNRYGVSLETFLYDPSGVMRMMLASHLRLSAVDRDSMIHVLKVLYENRRHELDSMPP